MRKRTRHGHPPCWSLVSGALKQGTHRKGVRSRMPQGTGNRAAMRECHALAAEGFLSGQGLPQNQRSQPYRREAAAHLEHAAGCLGSQARSHCMEQRGGGRADGVGVLQQAHPCVEALQQCAVAHAQHDRRGSLGR